MAKPRFDLHLSPSAELPKRFGKRIRAVGGTYSDCRGYDSVRYVSVPATKAGRVLADELLARFPGGRTLGTPSKLSAGLTCVILRSFPRVPELVTYVTATGEAEQTLRATARKLHTEGKLPRPQTAAARAAERLARATAQVERLRAALAQAEAELAELHKL
jgi:hypothetical protein